MSQDEAISKYELTLAGPKLNRWITADDPVQATEAVNFVNGALEKILAAGKPPLETFYATSVIDLLRRKFGTQGEGCLIDAACASSLAAIDMAVGRLQTHRADHD